MLSPGCFESGKKTRIMLFSLSNLSGLLPSVTVFTVYGSSRSTRMLAVGMTVLASMMVTPAMSSSPDRP